MQSRIRSMPIALAVGAALLAQPAAAHWCHDLWASSYNIVVKPAQDSVIVPSGGQVTLDLFVQNNMGYPLKNFSLAATASGFTVALSHSSPKKATFLLPGETLRYTATITGGSGTLDAEDLTFNVGFGTGGQDVLYGEGGKDVMLRKSSGLVPTAPFTFNVGSSLTDEPYAQALHLAGSTKADYLTGGIDALMAEFCVGRASWSTGNAAVITSHCSGTSTSCPTTASTPVNRSDTKYDFEHLWAAGELGYRKSALGANADVLRTRLMCAVNDTGPSFQFFPYAVLGYLGESASVRTFLTGKISSGTADEKAAAKSALLLFGNATDRASYHADVVTALSSSNRHVQMLAATTLGIIDADDAVVQSKLIATSDWVEPDGDANHGLAMYAAHLLNLVAWERRGWQANAGDTGTVSFYSTVPDLAPPRAPAGVSCSSLSDGGVRLSWSAVTQSADGGPETLQGYRTYRGTTARPGSATGPTDFSYDNRDPTSGVLTTVAATYTGLSATQPTYFAVVAVDTSSNVSAFSQEVSCRPTLAPVAVLRCSPDAGLAPVDLSCTSASSSDPNGASDIVSRLWALDGRAQDAGVTFGATFADVSTHTVQLTVVDQAGLRSTASSSIRVLSPNGGNEAPVALAQATSAVTGQAPLQVSFSSSGSSDPDPGQPISFAWDFQDGTAVVTTPNPNHTFSAAGVFDVTLTVSDDAAPPARSTAVVRVTVNGNTPPDVSGATASVLAGDAPLAVIFSGEGVTDAEGNALTFNWDFGDGSAHASTSTGTHTYQSAGTYTAVLSVTDDGTPALAAPATKSFTITVHTKGVANRPPDCSLATVTPTSGSAPLAVVLDATGCSDPDGDALSLTWHVPRSITTEDLYTEARVSTSLVMKGSQTIHLHVKDSAADSMEIDVGFPVVVGGSSSEPAVGGLGCSSASASAATGLGGAGLWLLLGLQSLRKRRRS